MCLTFPKSHHKTHCVYGNETTFALTQEQSQWQVGGRLELGFFMIVFTQLALIASASYMIHTASE